MTCLLTFSRLYDRHHRPLTRTTRILGVSVCVCVGGEGGGGGIIAVVFETSQGLLNVK